MPEPLRVLVGALGPGVLPTARVEPPGAPAAGTVLLDLGPDHPSRAGLLELRLWVAEGVIVEADVVVGALHRGAEKLFEVRDYRQILMLADRHDWQAPFAGELGIALATEQVLGLEVPSRAVWLRTLLAEHTRVASHLGFLGYLLRRLDRSGSTTYRERLREQLKAISGNRVHPMLTVVGGLAADASTAWLDAEVHLLTEIADAAESWRAALRSHPFADRLAGLTPLSSEVIHAYGVTGPAARASGLRLDLRRQDPYLAYAELGRQLSAAVAGPTSASPAAGDALARFGVLLQELTTSAALVVACADRLRSLPGPVAVDLPKVVKLPEGEVAVVTEAPLGWGGCWLVSRGEKTPWRLKLRTPSFNHISSLPAVLPGCSVADLEPALASIGYVVGDVDK
ncbi:MAG: NADH-quinone oxidoreductase subunit D [Propionibacteriaceae bacterium]